MLLKRSLLAMTNQQQQQQWHSTAMSKDHDDYRIALYYCYVSIDNIQECISLQQDLCDSLELCGRIRISQEGINGVLSGLYEKLLKYQSKTTFQLQLETKLDVKYCHLRSDLSVESQLFSSLSIKETRHVISLYEENDGGSSPPQHASHHVKKPAPHLSPQEWNDALLQNPKNAILVDARNVYESRVGHFRVEGIPTLFTNTRKYSNLPQVLQQSQELLESKQKLFLYCTGGVRCEQLSIHLQQTVPEKEIYQLDGGIQRYLEYYGSENDTDNKSETNNSQCLFMGKNFVFDGRRTDPIVGRVSTIGTCLVCHEPHDDYDNGHAPFERMEARCCTCRVLILCCNKCRNQVQCWSKQQETGRNEKPKLYCGGLSRYCCINEGNSIQPTIV